MPSGVILDILGYKDSYIKLIVQRPLKVQKISDVNTSAKRYAGYCQIIL